MDDDARFLWTSDVVGELGRGRNLMLDMLPAGKHTITLGVTDSDGFTATDSVEIWIGQRSYLPEVVK